jgi:hypothetical protein
MIPARASGFGTVPRHTGSIPKGSSTSRRTSSAVAVPCGTNAPQERPPAPRVSRVENCKTRDSLCRVAPSVGATLRSRISPPLPRSSRPRCTAGEQPPDGFRPLRVAQRQPGANRPCPSLPFSPLRDSAMTGISQRKRLRSDGLPSPARWDSGVTTPPGRSRERPAIQADTAHTAARLWYNVRA